MKKAVWQVLLIMFVFALIWWAIKGVFHLFFYPTLLAFRKNHEFRWFILPLNFFGFTWPISLIWAAL